MDDKELFETYKQDVYSFCFYMMQRKEDAEDLCQETFVRALLADRSHVKEVKHWLIQIAANICKNALSRSRRGSIKERLFLMRDHAVSGHSVEEAVENRELAYELSRMYGKLPPKIRIAMILRYINGLTQQEVAELIHVPLGTVKSRINKGLSLMRSQMAKELSYPKKGEESHESQAKLEAGGAHHIKKA